MSDLIDQLDQSVRERDALGSALDTAAAKISIQAEVAQRITFATHQCDVPLLADLVISNPGHADLEELVLRLSAEPKIVADRVWTIDRIVAESEFRPRDRRVSLAGGMLDSLTERMRAEIRFELRQGEAVLAERSYPVTALARNEWGGATFMPELLAAFVMPNDPTGPYGNKALGEPPTIPVAPALRNALLNATGVAVNSNPLDPQKLFYAFKEANLI